MYSGKINLEKNFQTVASMTLGKSLAFSKLKNEYKPLYSADIYKNIKFGDCKYSEYTQYSQTTFSCTVQLPFTAELNGNKIQEEVTLQILYIYSGKIRRVINYLEF